MRVPARAAERAVAGLVGDDSASGCASRGRQSARRRRVAVQPSLEPMPDRGTSRELLDSRRECARRRHHPSIESLRRDARERRARRSEARRGRRPRCPRAARVGLARSRSVTLPAPERGERAARISRQARIGASACRDSCGGQGPRRRAPAHIAPRSSLGETASSISASFSRPTPCSPVSEPPASMHSCMIS